MQLVMKCNFRMSVAPLVLGILFAATGSVFPQSLAAIETELLGYMKTMAESGTYSGNYDDAKLGPATESLKQRLMRYATRADVLKYDFPKLKEEMSIATSKDGKFRVYSWDLQTGGTMHEHDLVIQYVGKSGKTLAWSTTEDAEYAELGGFFTDVFQVATPKGAIYLPVSTIIASSALNGQSINAVRIVGDDLDLKANVIKTASGPTNSISFAYDFFTVVDSPERPVRLFRFNEARKEFAFPVVIEDEKTPQGRVTNKFITYRFNGTHFVKVN